MGIKPGRALNLVNFDLIQEMRPKVGGGALLQGYRTVFVDQF